MQARRKSGQNERYKLRYKAFNVNAQLAATKTNICFVIREADCVFTIWDILRRG